MMQGRKRFLIFAVVFGAVLTASCASIALNYNDNSDALWRMVNQECLSNQNQKNDATPCRQRDVRNGFVVMKDRVGPLQFLLLPTGKIAGIESPELLNPSTPNYFSDAWRARHFMEERRGKPIEDTAVSLAVNSQRGRTQNQLHIHISCLRPDIRQRLDSLSHSLTTLWQLQRLGDHQYLIRTVTRDEAKKTSPFIRIANELPGARQEMGKYGIAMASLPDGRRVVMVIKRNLLLLNRGSAEELQDHSCSLLNP